MQVTETSADGLKRELKVVVPASDLADRQAKKLDELKSQIRLKGFRPGKVPVSYLQKTYGTQVMTEVIQDVIGESSLKALQDLSLRPALQPKVDLDGDIEAVVAGKADLAYGMSFEIIPDITLGDFKSISAERPVLKVEDKEIDEAVERLATQQRSFEPREEGAAAETGDQLTIDFLGKLDGVPFEGGAAEDADLELGSGRFIPGFEEQLVGSKAGDDVVVNVTFPAEYGAAQLAGKDAVFDVKVKAVKKPVEAVIDDKFAENFGFDALDKLRDAVRAQIQGEYDQVSRQKLKRKLLDALDDLHAFEVPPSMVEQEFKQIWSQLEQELEHQKKTLADLEEPEETVRADYNRIAERRVRLGLVLAEAGEKNQITVTNEEINRAVMERARQFPGQERMVFDYYQKNPQALNEFRAPIFEDKVIDFIVELAQVADKEVSREELFAEDESDVLPHIPPHDHAHDHDHDHDHAGHDHEGHTHEHDGETCTDPTHNH